MAQHGSHLLVKIEGALKKLMNDSVSDFGSGLLTQFLAVLFIGLIDYRVHKNALTIFDFNGLIHDGVYSVGQ